MNKSKQIILFLFALYLKLSFQQQLNITTVPNDISYTTSQSLNSIRIKKPLLANYTRKVGDKIRLECEFDLDSSKLTANDFTIYWVKNYQELLQTKKGYIHVIRKNMSTILILKRLETFDSGSYVCIAELSSANFPDRVMNASSETTLIINSSPSNSKKPTTQKQSNKKQDINDYILSDFDNMDDLNDIPLLNPTVIENFDDKGFCEPYKGSICAGIITGNYSIYSTSANQQDEIEERLKTIIPLLASNKNNLSKRCSTFAVPSLCLFAFPLCDKQTKQPKQICRLDCKQLQQDICKNEYFNVKSIFETNKFNDNLQQSTNFLLDCNLLPPSSDSASDCLPIISMTLDKLESRVNEINNQVNQEIINQPPMVPIVQPSIPNTYVPDCVIGNGAEYRGMQSFSRNGFQCQKWSDQFPHPHTLNTHPDLVGHNYCRNIDNDVEPWCFTTNPQQRKDYCNIPKCTAISDHSDLSLFNNKKISVLLYIIVPSVSLSLVFIILTLCYCRRNNNNNKLNYVTKSINGQTATMLTMSPHQQQPQMIPPSNGQANLFQQNSRLRMSNASIGKRNLLNKGNCRGGSSKSSVASSANNNMELNPCLKPTYETLFNQPYLPQQQQQQPANEYNLPVINHVSLSNIRFIQEIGKGRFGPVYLGELIGTYAPNSVVKTVIKTLARTPKRKLFADELNMQTTSTPNVNSCFQTATSYQTDSADFYTEISVYSSLHNRYLTNLIGVSTSKSQDDVDDDLESVIDNQPHPQCMIFEHLNNSDLHEYLLQKSTNNANNMLNGLMLGGSQSNLSAASSIGGASSNYLNHQQQQRNIADFFYIGQQIASGMEYLASQNFVLKDLATRNILMSDNLTIKISIDLIAQYKEIYTKDYYKFQSKMLPVRWMSPESLLYGRFTQQSDVWSFGVCLWEIFNYGCQPYSGCTNPEAIEMIRDRQLLLIPEDCPPRAYALMLECWDENPMQRPTFTTILNKLREWENYHIFNTNNQSSNQVLPSINYSNQQNTLQQVPPLPLPLHLQQHQPAHSAPSFQMTSSYSSNSQNSKASSLLGNTASTGLSSCSPPPPPITLAQQQTQINLCYSPSKNYSSNTAAFASKFNVATNSNNNLYRGLEATNSLRMSQRNFINNSNNNVQSFSNNINHIPTSNIENHHFEL